MTSFKNEKVRDVLKGLASDFVQKHSSGLSLITITAVNLSKDHKNSTIFFTVLPNDKEEEALNFLKRKRSEFRGEVKNKTKLRRIPYMDFAIDIGEKNRQRIDDISNEK